MQKFPVAQSVCMFPLREREREREMDHAQITGHSDVIEPICIFILVDMRRLKNCQWVDGTQQRR